MLGTISLFGGFITGGIFFGKVCFDDYGWGQALAVTILLFVTAYFSGGF